MKAYDIVIVGAGPAGVSAALYSHRSGLDILVVSRHDSALLPAGKIENYYGLGRSATGREIVDNGLAQLRALQIPMIDAEVTQIQEGFTIFTTVGPLQAKSVILATGRKRNKVDIPGLEALVGSGVSYCAVCDGFFYKNKAVGVIGEGAYAAEEADFLKKFASTVTIFTNGKEFIGPVPDGIAVNRSILVKAEKQDHHLTLFLEAGQMPLDGLFVAVGTASSAEFAMKLGIMTENGAIKVDRNMATNVPGFFAAGDCTGGLMQIVTAASEGAVAATSALRYVKAQNKS